MVQGKLERLNEKRFGFISIEGQEKDVFFHESVLEGVNFDELKEGEMLELDFTEAEKGPQATVVRRAGEAAPEAANEEMTAPAEEAA